MRTGRRTPYQGVNDTLNTVAFALSTGTATPAAPVRIASGATAPVWSLRSSPSANDSGDEDKDDELDLLKSV